MTKPKYPLVLVDWEDAGADALSGWMDSEEAEHVDGFPAQTAGFLVRSDKTHVAIAQSIARNGGKVSLLMVIPRGCITRIKKLKV